MFPRCFVDRFNSCKSHINSLLFSIPAKPIRPGQQPASPSVRPGSSSGIGSALLGMTRLAGGAVMGSNVPNSPSTPSIPSSPNGATIVTPVIRGSKGSEPVVTYSKRIRNAVSTESLNRPLPQGSARWVLLRCPIIGLSSFNLLYFDVSILLLSEPPQKSLILFVIINLLFIRIYLVSLIVCKVKSSSQMSHWRFPYLTPVVCFLFFGSAAVGLLRFRRHQSCPVIVLFYWVWFN